MQILTNHIGYHTASAKRMILQCSEALAPNFPAPSAQLIDQDSGSVLRTLPVTSSGSVPGWKDRYFYLFDFSDFTRKGVFRFEVAAGNAQIHGLPFTIGDELLQDSCISDILFISRDSVLPVDGTSRTVRLLSSENGPIGSMFTGDGTMQPEITVNICLIFPMQTISIPNRFPWWCGRYIPLVRSLPPDPGIGEHCWLNGPLRRGPGVPTSWYACWIREAIFI